jgi:hypothetical protein
VLFTALSILACNSPVRAQGAGATLGPGPRLTSTQALADLRAAKIVPPQITASVDRTISAADFATLLLRTLEIDPRTVLKSTTAAAATPSQAVAAMRTLTFSANAKSFAAPAAPISREDAVSSAITGAATKGALRGGTRPAVFPPFADDSAFSNANARELAHEAVFAGLFVVAPDNRFRPRDPLLYSDAAYLLDAIRLSALSPEAE